MAVFGLFGKRPASGAPVPLAVEMEIMRPAAQVYRHLDWADPRNAMIEQGERVEPLGDGTGRYRLHLAGLPDHRFEFTVTQAERDERYGFFAQTTPVIGRLARLQSDYVLSPLDGGAGCRVELHAAAEFAGGLSQNDLQQEIGMMMLACYNSLARLKIHAEHGPDAARDAPTDESGCVLVGG